MYPFSVENYTFYYHKIVRYFFLFVFTPLFFKQCLTKTSGITFKINLNFTLQSLPVAFWLYCKRWQKLIVFSSSHFLFLNHKEKAEHNRLELFLFFSFDFCALKKQTKIFLRWFISWVLSFALRLDFFAIVEEEEAENKNSANHAKSAGIVRVRTDNEPLVLSVLQWPDRHLKIQNKTN